MQQDKVKIEFTSEEEAISKIILLLEDPKRHDGDWQTSSAKYDAYKIAFNNQPEEIPYAKILKIAASIFNCKEKELLQRTSENKGIMKVPILSFYYACNIFNNGEEKEFREFLGRSPYSMFGKRASKEIYYQIKHKHHYSKSILIFLVELVKECPKRLPKAIQDYEKHVKEKLLNIPKSAAAGTVKSPEKQLLFKLICINAEKMKIWGDDGKKHKPWYKELEFLERYGAYESVMHNGHLYYRLLQFNSGKYKDRIYLAERFHVVK